jgi:hypothetical protein
MMMMKYSEPFVLLANQSYPEAEEMKVFPFVVSECVVCLTILPEFRLPFPTFPIKPSSPAISKKSDEMTVEETTSSLPLFPSETHRRVRERPLLLNY